jgi:lysophospholipase L1-like esterase
MIPGSDERHAFEDRWPNALAAGLGGQARAIEEGLNGRFTVHDDPASEECRNGADVLPMLLASHSPLDLAIILLGTNDLQWIGPRRAFDAMWGMARLIEIVQRFGYRTGMPTPEILVVSPPHLGQTANPDYQLYYPDAIEESRKLAGFYARIASEMKCHFFDAASVSAASPIDGCHLDAANTRAIGIDLVPHVRRILGL